MDRNQAILGKRIQEVRRSAEVSQEDASATIGVSQPTYSRIESGERTLKGYELVQLADLFGVRASAISGLTKVRERARSAARTDGTTPAMEGMREKLHACLELDAYLTDQGIE